MTEHDNEYGLETRRAYSLTDRDLLGILAQRAGDMNALGRLKSLVTIFEHAAKLNPDHAPGLMAAANLTRLFGYKIQPGHENHPFTETVSSVAGCFGLVMQTPTTKSHKEPPCTSVAPAKRVVVERGKLTGNIPLVQNVPKPTKEKAFNKSAYAREVILAQAETFTAASVHALCASEPRIWKQDVENAMASLRRGGAIIAQATGGYRVNR